MEQKKRGQSAMEFLMTYGWAILVLIIVIAVLFYMGVMDPKKGTGDTCMLAPGFSCYSFKVSSGSGALHLDLGQASGDGIVVTAVGCSDDPADTPESLANPVYIPSGEHRYVVGGNSLNQEVECISEEGSVLGSRYKGVIRIDYETLSDGVGRVVYGDISVSLTPPEVTPDVIVVGCAPDCPLGANCTGHADCESGYCSIATMTCATCTSRCPEGAACTSNTMCLSRYCDPISRTCTSGIAPITPTPTPCESGGVINYCPCSINSSGTYVLNDHLGYVDSDLITCLSFGSGAAGSTLDCNGFNVSGNSALNIRGATGMTVKDCVIHGRIYGIDAADSPGIVIMDNAVDAQIGVAIRLDSSDNSVVSGNAADYSNHAGIAVLNSNNVAITGNYARWNFGTLAGWGIRLYSCVGCVVSGNTACENNEYDILCEGGEVAEGSTGNYYDDTSGCGANLGGSSCGVGVPVWTPIGES